MSSTSIANFKMTWTIMTTFYFMGAIHFLNYN